MTRAGVITVLVLGCSNFGGPSSGARSGGGPAPEPNFSDPPAFFDSGVATPPAPFASDGPTAMDSPQCFRSSVLPAGCTPDGEWRLTHGQPEGDCPFGASQHVIRLFIGGGYVCLQPIDDFQRLEAGPPGACAVALSGMHVVPAASDPYTETWTSQLTFAASGGTGATQVVVAGRTNCMRKFQTTIDRK